MKRLHTTDAKTLILSDRPYSQMDRGINKPFGLWYSIGNEWFEWCKSEDFGGIGEFTFTLDVDESRLKIIDSQDNLTEFFNKYKSHLFGSRILGIDWEKVAADFTGIEIRNYYALKWSHVLPMEGDLWLYGWDVSSGCIWDLTAVKGFKKRKTNPKWLQPVER